MTTQTPVRRSLTVPGRPEQAAAARQFAARALGPRHPHAETAVLLVSELVTNSLRHSASSDDGGTITITVITSPGELVRVEVTDDGAATVPMVQPACGEDEAGRGMQLVSALASAWNCRREGSRTTTWFELAPRPQRAGGRVGVAGLSGAPPPGTAGSAWPPPGRPAQAEVLRGQEPPVTWPEVAPRATPATSPAPPGAAVPATPALPRRISDALPAAGPGSNVQPAAGPDMLRRVLDGLNRL